MIHPGQEFSPDGAQGIASPTPIDPRQHRFQQLMLDLASSFIELHTDNLDAALEKALGDMARLVGADRACILVYRHNTGLGAISHEWCAPGIAPLIGQVQRMVLADCDAWMQPHARGEPICINDVALLPDGELKRMLEPLDFQGVLALPLMDNGACLGCVGFDAVTQPGNYRSEDVALLALFAQLLVDMHRKQRAGRTVTQQRDTL